MSGVGEVLAVVSCVAGLIQTYDAGSRILRQIKARRQARGFPPPTDIVEESIEKSKREIQEVVACGEKRFGFAFEEGDTTAQLALYRITIETQKALLEGLTEARDDDGIVDFENCINASNWGRSRALLELNSLFSRKLDEELERRRKAPNPEAFSVQSSVTPSTQTPTATQFPPTVQLQTKYVPQVVKTRAGAGAGATGSGAGVGLGAPTPFNGSKRPKSFFSRRPLLRREPQPNQPKNIETPHATKRSSTYNDTWPLSSRLSTFVNPETARLLGSGKPTSWKDSVASTASTKSTASTSIWDERDYTISSDTSTTASSMGLWNTTISTGPLPQQSTIVPLNLSSTSVELYGSLCKFANQLRDGIGFESRFASFEEPHLQFKCPNSRCQFWTLADYYNTRYRISDTVYRCAGIDFRWTFLAKSHVATLERRPFEEQPYLCMICIMLGQKSDVYRGQYSLMSHITGHRGESAAGTLLNGSLTFRNNGVNWLRDPGNFDLCFPEALPFRSFQHDAAYDRGANFSMAANYDENVSSKAESGVYEEERNQFEDGTFTSQAKSSLDYYRIAPLDFSMPTSEKAVVESPVSAKNDDPSIPSLDVTGDPITDIHYRSSEESSQGVSLKTTLSAVDTLADILEESPRGSADESPQQTSSPELGIDPAGRAPSEPSKLCDEPRDRLTDSMSAAQMATDIPEIYAADVRTNVDLGRYLQMLAGSGIFESVVNGLTYIRSTVRSHLQTLERRPSVRITWKCACGSQMHAQIVERKPGAAIRLQESLQASSARCRDHLRQMTGAASNSGSPQNSAAPSSPSMSTASNTASTSTPNLQYTYPSLSASSTSSTLLGTIQPPPVSSAPERRYLLLCVTSALRSELSQLDLTTISNDEYMFNLIRTELVSLEPSSSKYVLRLNMTKSLLGAKGQVATALIKWLTPPKFTTVTSLDFVRFRLVPIREETRPWGFAWPRLPPEHEIKKQNYLYAPCPQDDYEISNLDHVMLHSLLTPGPHLDQFWLDQFPKKLKTPLCYSMNNPQANIAWGIRLRYGVNWTAIVWILVLVVAASGVGAVLYSILLRDPSGAFQIAGYVVTAVTLNVAYLQLKSTSPG